jgi:NADH dehydrogenase [ubiquinone] 1 alpha subcomplex assembly factor 7
LQLRADAGEPHRLIEPQPNRAGLFVSDIPPETPPSGPRAPYDPQARRETPLALKLIEHIRAFGPMTVQQYMTACLYDPEHGYYRREPAIGADADFITAPEISQCFGELLGLWAAVVWQQLGSPAPFRLIEYGPGRGTLMADALRAASRVAGFREAARIVLHETNDTLRAVQAETLRPLGCHVVWAGRADDATEAVTAEIGGEPGLENLPAIVLANEFLDTYPITQLVHAAGDVADVGSMWRTRMVDVDAAGRLVFTEADTPVPVPPHLRAAAANAKAGDILEVCPARQAHLLEFLDGGSDDEDDDAELDAFEAPPRVALYIDYGQAEPGPGDTLQAVRRHAFEHPLTSPGEADLTCQVDFTEFAAQAVACDLVVDGPTTQAEFLGALGILQRASKLMSANPSRASLIEAGVLRIMAPTGMGTRFKVMCVRSPMTEVPPGFRPR